jgi:uncharacterized iron-regulated membrane protein
MSAITHDRRVDHGTRRRVSEFVSSIRHMRVALVCLVVMWLVGLFGIAVLFDKQADSRRDACWEVNHRHDNTLIEINNQITTLPDGPRKTRALEQTAQTRKIIDALQPKRDCNKVVPDPVPVL